MTKECKQQFILRITQGNSTDLIVILYEMILCYLEEGIQALEAGETADFREAVRKTRGCFNELLNSLHMEYELAGNLLQLYFFCIRSLAQAEVKKDGKPLKEITGIIQKLHDAYEQVAAQNAEGSVMNNAQAVYAGLTYGRNALAENMADQSANRGLLV